MANGEKTIHTVIKYSQEGAEEVAETQRNLREGFSDAGLKNIFGNFSASVKQADKDARTFNVSLETTQRSFHNLRMAGRELAQVGTLFAVAGGLLTAGLVADANNYVKTVGIINQTSAQWLGYENQIREANLEIGETAAQALLPTMKAAADFMERVANFVQQNPWLVQGALTVGGILAALGVATRVIAELIRVTADIGLLLGRMGLTAAATKVADTWGAEAGMSRLGFGGAAAGPTVLGTVTLTATSVIIGAELGQALGNYLGRLIYGETYQKQNLQDAFITFGKIFQLPWVMLAQVIGRLDPALTGTTNKFIEFINNLDAGVGKLIGASRYVGMTPEQAQQHKQLTQEEVQGFIQFQEQMKTAQENYGQQRADIVAQHEQQIRDVTEQYEQQRADIVANFSQQAARAARDFAQEQDRAVRNYNESVAKTIRDFHIQQRRNLEQHQVEMARLEQTHNMRMFELRGARDALGLVKEQMNYDMEKAQKEQDFARNQAYDREQNALKLQDMKQSFEQQRADALAAYEQRTADQQAQEQQQLARLDAQHKLEMAKLDQQEKDKLSRLDDAYKKQIEQIQNAFIDRLRALDANLLGDTAAFTAWMQKEALQFQAWLARLQSSIPAGGLGSRASGGYAPYGLYRLGDTPAGGPGGAEFVMNAASTRMAEALIGRSLNQQNLISTLYSGRAGFGGNRSIHMTVVGGSLSIQQIREITSQTLDMRLADLLPAFGAM